MTIKLDISPELEQKINRQAKRVGLDVAGYLHRLIEIAPEDGDLLDASPTETVAYWLNDPFPIFEGLPDSPELARDLRHQAETRSGHNGS